MRNRYLFLGTLLLSTAVFAVVAAANHPGELKATGGGKILVNDSTFGFEVMSRGGSLYGNILYISHATGMRFKSENVTLFACLGASPDDGRCNYAVIEGYAEVNGTPGYYYSIDVEDNTPGADYFSLWIYTLESDGLPTTVWYDASDYLGGGSIQIFGSGSTPTMPD